MSEQQDSNARPADLLAMMPFAIELGIELTGASASKVGGKLRWREALCTSGGVLHGGVLMSFADSLGGICAYLNVPPGGATSTISSTTNFLRPLRDGHAIAIAQPLRVGRSVIVVQTEVRDATGELLAHTTQAQAVLTP
jgi:1,4-dihydroxy-2-naphthoyl-CoA hydrolase